MQPETPRDFLKVAAQRLDAAQLILRETDLTLEAQYIGGYTVECFLKPLILEITPIMQRLDALYRLTHGATNHQPETLLSRLKDLGISLSVVLTKRIKRFDWSPNLRYEIGRKDVGETNGLLRTAVEVYQWVQEQIG